MKGITMAVWGKCLVVSVLVVLAAGLAAADAEDSYKPIFSKQVLDKADPEARARLLDIEARNRSRWEQSQQGIRKKSEAAQKPRGIYKQEDANGNVVYTDSSDGRGDQKVKVGMQQPDQRALSEHEKMLEQQRHTLELIEDQKRMQQQQQEERKKIEAAKKKHKRKCAELKNEIADYQRGGAVYYELDDKGQRHYFDDSELKDKVAELESVYRKKCR